MCTDTIARIVSYRIRLIPAGLLHYITMGQRKQAPTAEQVAEAAGGDIETAQQALLAVQFDDDPEE